MKLSLCLISLFLSASIALAQNSVPLVTQPLIPDTHIASGIGFTLNVHGTGFVSSSMSSTLTMIPSPTLRSSPYSFRVR